MYKWESNIKWINFKIHYNNSHLGKHKSNQILISMKGSTISLTKAKQKQSDYKKFKNIRKWLSNKTTIFWWTKLKKKQLRVPPQVAKLISTDRPINDYRI